MADRERFSAWIDRELARWAGASDEAGFPRCLGGPVDGMLADVACSIGRQVGASLYLPALLILTSPLGETTALEHRYARDHRGAYVYVGLARVEAA